MASDTKATMVKVRPSNQDGSSGKGKVDLSVTKKKIDSSIKRPIDLKNRSAPISAKSEVKGKSISSSSKLTSTTTTTKTTTKTTVKPREKKVFTLAGQKFDPPEEREPLRIFYESLSEQIPSSEMAEFWMMEHGLLSPDKSRKAHEKKQRKQKQLRLGTPIKKSPPPPPSRPESSQRQPQQQQQSKVRKRITNDIIDHPDFVFPSKRRKC